MPVNNLRSQAYANLPHPADDDASKVPELSALPSDASRMLSALNTALECHSFMVSGGRIGFPLKHAYPASLQEGIEAKVGQPPD